MTILIADNGQFLELEIGPVALFQITKNNLEEPKAARYCAKCLNEIFDESFYRGATKSLPVMMFHPDCVKEYL